MDLSTIIGLILGVALVLAAIGGALPNFIDVPSALIVIGGGIAATLLSLPLERVLKAPRILKNAFFTRKTSNSALVAEVVRFGEIARRDGILALEGVLGEVEDPFLARGLQLAVDGSDPESIAVTLESEMSNLAGRHRAGKQVFELLGKYAPAFGMIGTLIGLVLMLQNMKDPSQIAPNMAIALLTTLYGAMLANMVALPLADKLQVRTDMELARMGIVTEGIIAIQSGDNPKVVEQKLQIFLAPVERVAA